MPRLKSISSLLLYESEDKKVLEKSIMEALRWHDLPLGLLYKYLVNESKFYKFTTKWKSEKFLKDREIIEKQMVKLALYRLRRQGKIWLNNRYNPPCWCVEPKEESKIYAPDGPDAYEKLT